MVVTQKTKVNILPMPDVITIKDQLIKLSLVEFFDENIDHINISLCFVYLVLSVDLNHYVFASYIGQSFI